MSEYHFVEKPFLDQLQQLDWDLIDQVPAFPTDPAMDFCFVLPMEDSYA